MNDKITRYDRYRYTMLWLAEHFFDSNKKVKKLSASLSEKIPEELGGLGEHGENHIPVLVIEEMNVEEFIKNPRGKSQPVVLKNAASSWPIYKKWTPEFFAEQYPEDPVILFDGAIESRESPKEKGAKTVSLADFVEAMKNGGFTAPTTLHCLNHLWIDLCFSGVWQVARNRKGISKKQTAGPSFLSLVMFYTILRFSGIKRVI
jgi:hypothetical protein